MNLRVVQLLRGPLANLSIITDGNDIVGVLGTNHIQAVNRIIVSILSENTVEYRCSLGTHIPLDDVTRLSRTNNQIWVERIVHGFSDLILTC